jgi:glycerol transport system ATP-binding protein
MPAIALDKLGHSYLARPSSNADWAIKQLDLVWEEGGAYALLGPSGCGKTTLLNIISGLLKPTAGRVLFDQSDVTEEPPEQRNIAQVFQFPVVYDTMTVYDNLAFPLRNRGVDEGLVRRRVHEIADLLELGPVLKRRAAGLSADGKQKISLGRGLVREDVNIIMFDEPLTVIDPHLKWQLRSKLKEIHQRLRTTMIYVTHDQTEALTFADQVVVMKDGEVVQNGTPVELFERPRHTFVGHFIGSPGMNVLPVEICAGQAHLNDTPIQAANATAYSGDGTAIEIGVRPEFVRFAETGLPVRVTKVADAGRYRVVDTAHGGVSIKLLISGEEPIPPGEAHLQFDPAHTQLYQDGWIIDEARS